MCALDIYLMTMLSSSYGIIMYCATNGKFMERMVVMGSVQLKNYIRSNKWNLLVN